jgi:phosphomannomutase
MYSFDGDADRCLVYETQGTNEDGKTVDKVMGDEKTVVYLQ